MFNQLSKFNKRYIYNMPNNGPNNKESHIHFAIISGVMSTMFGLTLWAEKKPTYTENERVCRFATSGLTTITCIYSIINIIKYLKK